MILADLHSHTIASHGTHDAAAMFAKAGERGLEWFGLSEHSPLPPGFHCALYTGDLGHDFPAYAREVQRLKAARLAERNGHGPRALLGLELDWLPSRLAWMRQLVAQWPFDYVLGALHYLDGMSVGSLANWGPEISKEERFARFAAYFYELASLARSGLVQAVAHPDFIKLRAWEDFQLWLNMPESHAPIAAALEALAQSATVMEVSAAGLRQVFAEPYPAPPIMRLAREIGVEICFGSDAHSPADVAKSFDSLAAYAHSFGFRQSVIFINRQPQRMAF